MSYFYLTTRKFSVLCAALALLTASHGYSARCNNFSSTSQHDNKRLCAVIKAVGTQQFACVPMHRETHCESICHLLSDFKENCVANTACEWHPLEVVNPCRERTGGWNPQEPLR